MTEENEKVRENTDGEVILSKERDIYEQIGRLDRRLDGWQEGLPDLNRRVKALEDVSSVTSDEVKNVVGKSRGIQAGVDNVMKLSARVEGEFLKRLQMLEQLRLAETSLLGEHVDHFKDAGVRLVELECWQEHHPEDHAALRSELVSLHAAFKVQNDSIRDLFDRLSRLETSYNKMLEFTDQKMVRYDQRLSGSEQELVKFKEGQLSALVLELKDLKNQGIRHEMDLDYLKQTVESSPPTKIRDEVGGPMPTEETVRCAICVHRKEGEMSYEISGIRVGARGCRLVGENDVVYFRGLKCKRFEEKE